MIDFGVWQAQASDMPLWAAAGVRFLFDRYRGDSFQKWVAVAKTNGMKYVVDWGDPYDPQDPGLAGVMLPDEWEAKGEYKPGDVSTIAQSIRQRGWAGPIHWSMDGGKLRYIGSAGGLPVAFYSGLIAAIAGPIWASEDWYWADWGLDAQKTLKSQNIANILKFAPGRIRAWSCVSACDQGLYEQGPLADPQYADMKKRAIELRSSSQNIISGLYQDVSSTIQAGATGIVLFPEHVGADPKIVAGGTGFIANAVPKEVMAALPQLIRDAQPASAQVPTLQSLDVRLTVLERKAGLIQ